MDELGLDNIDIDEQEDEKQIQNIIEAVPIVLKKALMHNGLVRGLHQVAKALDGKKVRVCFLAKSCSEEGYISLVQALCKAGNVPVIDVPESKDLGEWAGLCKIDKDGLPRKIVGTSCVAVTDYGEESAALGFLQNHIASMAVASN